MDEVNVRVAVRVRPLLPKEKVSGEQLCVRVVPANNQIVVGKDRSFTFDNVITSKSTQDEVFKSCVEPLVKSCFEGYNSTIFAYGQTGSGKTYTIGGGNIASLTEEEFGVIPRAVQEIFSIIQSKSSFQVTVKVSYIELYKEDVRDLLDIETSSKDLHIREDDNGNTVVTGTREVKCESKDEVMYILEHGSASRHTGSTQMNEHSSRSHSIFTITIEQCWSEDDQTRQDNQDSSASEVFDQDVSREMTHCMSAKFHFVDLAGSERAHKTGNVGDRFKESVHINSGLLALGNVISALGDPKRKVSHIPYRDSKITRLLKDSLGGNANTLMLCCISPATSSFDETLNSLKYANRARNIRNKPVVNRDVLSQRFEEMQTEIKALREELQRQRTSVFTAGGSEMDMEKAVHDAGQIKTLEDQLIKMQTECSHYRVVAEEAYKQLMEIQERDLLSKSQRFRLRDWLDLMEEIKNKVPKTLSREQWENETVLNLKNELKQAQNDLRNDEEIFSEKASEIEQLHAECQRLQAENEEYAKQLEFSAEKNKQHEESLLSQQMMMADMEQKVKEMSIKPGVSFDLSPGPPSTSRRAKSVPVNAQKRPNTTGNGFRPLSRNVHTSPALYSMERVLQGFRARSQLLVNRLDDDDEVVHHFFSSDEDDDGTSSGKSSSVKSSSQSAKLKGTFTIGEVDSIRKKASKRRTSSTSSKNRPTPLPMGKTITKGKIENGKEKTGVWFGEEDSQLDFEVDKLKSSIDVQSKKIKQSQLNMQESNQKMRDLAINIKLKEQLIRELVKTGKESEKMNKQYAEKIKTLNKDKDSTSKELVEVQKAFQELEVKGQQETAEKKRLQSEYRKKIESAKSRLTTLKRKHKDTEKMANLTTQNDKRIQDLELAVDRMKNQHNLLQKKAKEENEIKSKLEREMTKEQQKIKELEIKNDQQQKILRRKNEELAAMQRRLRSGSGPQNIVDPETSKLEEQKKWLDGEIEKVLSQRQQVERLQEELKKREEIVTRRETVMGEKSELEMKKLRSSQVLTKDIASVVHKLDSVEKKLAEKTQLLSTSPDQDKQKLAEDVKNLQRGQHKLKRQREVLDAKLYEGALLSPQEERRMLEIDEAIDALDAAIEYKNDAIQDQEMELRRSRNLTQSEDDLTQKLSFLSTTETKSLLYKYFEKVINLRESERHHELQVSEYEVKVDEQERLLREMDAALQAAAIETDRRLTQQQQEYEQKIQLLVRQLTTEGSGGGDNESQQKVHMLEKDLFYYKKTSRDLKKKLRELMGGIISQDGGGDGVEDSQGSVVSSAPTPRTHRESSHHTPRPSSHAHSEASHRGTPRHHEIASPRHPPLRESKSDGTNGSRRGTPIKISRKDLRPMSEAEISLRRSSVTRESTPGPTDSLDDGDM